MKRWVDIAVLSALGLVAAIPACGMADRAQANVVQAAGDAVASDALTFAQVDDGGRIATILVLRVGAESVQGIDLSARTHHYASDAFDVVGGLAWDEVARIAAAAEGVQTFPMTRLVGVGPRGLAHIAAGTNYPEHGKETGMDQGAFLFPKFSQATGPADRVEAAPGVLLDYEAEICARFDREIRTVADFESARKGFFLCGDFSDRAALFRGIDLEDPYSGDGFADAKSGPGRFPTGPFLVVPRDWEGFLETLDFQTIVDGEKRQDVRASDMIKDLRTIVAETLAEGSTRTWSYDAGRVPMIRRTAIGTESAVLTGTGDGVVFREPDPALIEELMASRDRDHQLDVIGKYIAAEEASRKYLQPGNLVRYTSNHLGTIETRVVSPRAGGEGSKGAAASGR